MKDTFCKYCCRLLRWVKNPKDSNPNRWQTICCGRVYYEREKPLMSFEAFVEVGR